VPTTSREIRLAARPRGAPVASDFELTEVELPDPGDGEILVRNAYVSVDPYMRGRMNDAKSYAAPQPLGQVMQGGTVGEVVDLGLTQPKFRGYVLGGFAGIALILSAASLYGLLSFLVAQRNREIGVRMALGALPVDIFRVVLGKGIALTVTGVCMGLLIAFGFARLMSALVYGIGFGDPLTFIAGTAVLLLVSFLASYLPARRAMRLNLVDVLRSE